MFDFSRFLIFRKLLFVFFFAITSLPLYSMDSSLVLHYTFDGNNATDYSQYGNDGAVTDCQWLSFSNGRTGVMRFNDTTSSIICGNDNSLYFDGDMTIEMWVRWNQPIVNQWCHIFGESSDNFFFAHHYYHSLLVWYKADEEGNPNLRIPVNNSLIEDFRSDSGGWSHVAIVFEYPRCRFYKNGELFYDAYMMGKGIHNEVNRAKFIGDKGSGISAPMDLDEFRWYRRALSAAEIAAHAAGENPGPMSEEEVFLETHWYKDTITARLSSKGYNYSGYTVEMEICENGNTLRGPVTASMTEAFAGCGRYVASNSFSLSGLENKTLTGVFRIYNSNGIFLKNIQTEVSTVPPDWVDTTAGYSTSVPQPWSAVQTQENSDGTIDVEVWGRKYSFGSTPFFNKIQTQGTDILTGPIKLRAKTGTTEFTWNPANPILIESSDAKATINQTYTDTENKLKIDINSEIEYDGYVLFDLSIEALANISDPAFNFIVVEIPISTGYATLCMAQNAMPEDPTIPMATNFSGAITQTENFRFSPDVWIGNEEIGLVYQAESDQYWRYSNDQPLELDPGYPSAGTTTLSLRLINIPTTMVQGETFHYKFALMATPVKPLLRDGFDLRIVRSDPYGEDLSLPTRTRPDGQPMLEYYSDIGIRNLFINTCTLWPWPMPTTSEFDAALRDLVASVHSNGLQLHNYVFHQRYPVNSPDFDIHGRHMSKIPFAMYTQNGVPEDSQGNPLPPFSYHGPLATHYGANSQAAVFYCAKSKALQDSYLANLTERLDTYGDDGVYLDGTGALVPCSNTEHGCGYYLNGARYTTYPTFSSRKFLQRIYNVVKSRNPDGLLDVHMSFGQNHAALAYADVLWTGEQWYHLKGIGAPGGYISGELPLDMFRAEFMGRQMGIASEVLEYRLGDPFKVSAISLLHDISVRVRTSGAEGFFETTMYNIWKLRDQFGIDNAQKLFYWNNSAYINVNPGGCYATLFKHPHNGVLAIISNLNSESQNLEVDFNLQALDLDEVNFEASNALTKSQVNIDANGIVNVYLNSEEWVYLWLKPTQLQGSMNVIFSDDFEDDIDYDDGIPLASTHFENGPPVNEGRSGRWLPGHWNIDPRHKDQNWNINVVKDSTWTWYYGEPVAKPGKELYYECKNMQDFENPFGREPYNYYDGFQRDGFGKFTDVNGNPVTVTQGQTIRGSFKVCRLGGFPAFALTTDIEAMAASTANEPYVTDENGSYPYVYSTLQHWESNSESWNSNVAAILAMAQGAGGGQWFRTILPTDPTNLNAGVTSEALDSQRTGIDPFLAIHDNSDRQNNKPYQEIYFQYTVGNQTWDILKVDGVDIHVWEKQADGIYYETSRNVPFGNYLGATANGIDGFVLGHLQNYNGNPIFYDDFEFGILPSYCGDLGTQYFSFDLNKDCYVDLLDFAMSSDNLQTDVLSLLEFATQWLECTDPAGYDCIEY